MDLKFCGADFSPNVGALSAEIIHSRHNGGIIILPSSNEKGFEITKYSSSVADIEDNGATVDDLWDCTIDKKTVRKTVKKKYAIKTKKRPFTPTAAVRWLRKQFGGETISFRNC